jgi:hypothetical protein
MITRKLQAFLLVAGCAVLFSLQAAAQYTDGSIDGMITDPSGASISGATVHVTNAETGQVFTVATDSSGYYRVVHLRPSKYRVRVEQAGFKTSEASGVAVNVDSTTRVDMKLQVGAVSETVEVSGGVPLVQTEESRLSDIISSREVTDLPLNGREIYQLLTLQPGVTATNAPVVSSVPSTTSGLTFSFGFISNGATPRANNFVLDGLSNNNEWLGGTPLITPSVDAIQEFQIQTLNFSAEYGRNDGAIANVVTKSGTNAFHGSVYDFLRNSALNARNYFDLPGQKAPVVQNLFGFSLGGPIRKDKTLFFVNYEGSRRKDGAPSLFEVETPQFRNLVETIRPATFAAMFYKDFPAPSCNPAYPIVDVGSIPPPSAGPIAPPGPPDGIPDYCTASSPQIAANNNNQYLVRVDHKFTEHDQFYARWINTLSSADVSRGELYSSNIRGFHAPLDGFFSDLGTGYTHMFSNSMLNDLRFSYARNNSRIGFQVPPNSETEKILQAAGVPNVFGNLYFDDGVTSIGGSVYVPRSFVFNSFSVVDTLSKVIGRHSLKFGFQFRRVQENSNYGLVQNPFYEFTNIFDFANDEPYLVEADVNRNPSSPLFGHFVGTPRHFRWNQPALFVQDDWKLRRNLTVNLGLRWERYGSPSETNGLLANMMFPSGDNLTMSEIVPEMPDTKVGRVSQLWKAQNRNFAPRIGVSWDPTGSGKMAVRAGYSIAYQEPYSNLYTQTRLDPPDASLAYSYPAYGVGTDVNYTFPFQPSPDFKAPVNQQGGIQGTKIYPEGVMPDLKTAYAEQWFFGIQREFARSYGVTMNYVGTRGVKNYTREDYNRYDGDVCNPTSCSFVVHNLNPAFGQIYYISNEGYSYYHGFNAQLRKIFSHGVNFVANYTFGKVLDNVTEGGLGDYANVNAYAGLYAGVEDLSRPHLDYGSSEFDVRHRFTLTGTWDVPHPHFSGAGGKILGGWQLNTIVSLQSGRPFDVFCGLPWYEGCDFNMDGLNYDRPNSPANVPRSGYSERQFINGVFGDSTRTISTSEVTTSVAIEKFCPNGLVPFFVGTPCVPVGSEGNLSRNAFRGPSFKDVDLSLFKNTKVNERLNVQFRAEAFNLFNRTNLFNPNDDLGGPFFGQSTAAFASRQIQFGLKLLF